jgi:putative component of membrane protein insertase Oxa1/YidC/SpoIIIJ protein YidD
MVDKLRFDSKWNNFHHLYHFGDVSFFLVFSFIFLLNVMSVCTSGSILMQLWRNFWQIIKGHLLKSVKRMKRCTNRNKNLIDPFVYENFSLTGLKCLNDKNITQSRNKWCWQNVLQNLYERIGTFITGCSTFKIESIRSHTLNGHTKNTLNYEATQCKPG